ncbi:ATP-dependent RNA helicase DDX10/DBP4 [Nematocida homosporus]|uniref:ATP-dependent RNA helicase DDX10/DBP4 n=1 Tax=Nematocida homosporus TaxID=1912981 RepID=UPI00221F5114|nr:ATP-dependent RNA helicase DDX10/DBP4 [Nematocida homosporus]KAI5186893.1 ATP-dependent RNA helicase DDX10/DBP4 [Nematocida homosporus]
MAFTTLHLQSLVLKGLTASQYTEPTEVQRKIIVLAKSRGNIVCSAQTGSGKTLSFVIPILERLLELKWTRADGLGAVIIAPTRELALQIFEVVKAVGRETNLSGGLLIGGRSVEREKECVSALNLVVCTPGRLLEHLEMGWGFNGDSLEMLVIDEADKLLEMGFKQTISRILEYLPRKRQTLLFSATAEAIGQARKLWDISKPEWVIIKERAEESNRMSEEVWLVDAAQKFDLLYELTKRNLRRKTIVFLSTCKEVTFFHDLFKGLRLGVPVLRLNGNMAQTKRVETYHKFCRDEPRMLFCTDIAARGLDFPGVDLVVQLDAPESVATYVHRAGRTARNGAKGRVVLAVLEREKDLLSKLSDRPGFPEAKVYASKRTIAGRVQGAIKASPELYLGAQKYVKTYAGFMRVSKHGRGPEEAAALIKELAEYLGVEEDSKVSWSKAGRQKSKLLNRRITFDDEVEIDE